jgi:histidinol-phosphatase (PHP family)
MNAPRIPDHHVHTEWSWDATRGDMERTCARALELGLPSIAFTEHADWIRGEGHVVEIDGYLECIERCRARFPDLRILSGVELGEPHRHEQEARDLLRRGRFERLLGSVHCFEWKGQIDDASTAGFLTPEAVGEQFREFLAETTAMLAGDLRFEVLAHLDYPKRYWPAAAAVYNAGDFEAEFRTVLRAAARAGVALEINTTRGGEPDRYLCPSPQVLAWWAEEGGRAMAFGSDAHDADRIAAGFALAAQAVEAAGFKPQDDPNEFWRR